MADVLYPDRSVLDRFLKDQLKAFGFSLKQRGYVAPTVFLRQGKTVPNGWAYYNSKSDAFEKLKYLFHKDGRNVTPAGYVSLKKDGTAQTIGINVDFYFAVNPLAMVNLGYEALKFSIENNTGIFSVFRFFKADASGPYYAIFDPKYLGGAATIVSSYSGDKIAALDNFHREAALLKARHNILSAYLNQLAVKRLSPTEQQIFNEGSLRLQTMRAEMAQIEGLEVYYSKDGRIGVLPILAIAWIVVGAIAVSWGLAKIVEQYQKTARLNSSYNVQKWVVDQKLKIVQEVNKGTITPAAAAAMINDLDQVSRQAGLNAEAASQPSPSMFGEISEIVKWAAIGFGVYAIANAVSSGKSNKRSK